MVLNWNPALLDEYVSPGISSAKDIILPDPPTCPNYYGSFFLNHAISGLRYPPRIRQLYSIFIRRTWFGSAEYQNAFDEFYKYVKYCEENKTNNYTTGYIKFLFHLESSLIQLSIGIISLLRANRILDVTSLPSDNDNLVKLRRLYNRIKHYDEDLESVEEDRQHSIPATPIWIENNQICSRDASLSLETYVNIIRTLIEDSRSIAEEIPAAAVKKIKNAKDKIKNDET